MKSPEPNYNINDGHTWSPAKEMDSNLNIVRKKPKKKIKKSNKVVDRKDQIR